MKQGIFELYRGEVRFMEGSFSLLATVFNRLNGSCCDSSLEQRKYQQTMGPALMGGELQSGEVVSFRRSGVEFARYEIGGVRQEEVTELRAMEGFRQEVLLLLLAHGGSISEEELVAQFRSGASSEETAQTLRRRSTGKDVKAEAAAG